LTLVKKAFDTIRHSTFLNTMALLDIHDAAKYSRSEIYYIWCCLWLVDFFATGTVQGMAEPRPLCLTSLLVHV